MKAKIVATNLEKAKEIFGDGPSTMAMNDLVMLRMQTNATRDFQL